MRSLPNFYPSFFRYIHSVIASSRPIAWCYGVAPQRTRLLPLASLLGALLVGSSVNAELVPMLSLDSRSGDIVLNLHLYDTIHQEWHLVKDSANKTHSLCSLDSTQTHAVYAEETDGTQATIRLYTISDRTLITIQNVSTITEEADTAAYFDASDRILYVDQGFLKRYEIQGGESQILSEPEAPYHFSMFWITSDRQKLLLVENRREGADYETGNFERLVLMNSDGSGRRVVLPEYLGEWNNLGWNVDGTTFQFYHHRFVPQEEIPQYILGTWNGTSFDITTLITPGIWDTDENVCAFTPRGNLLGWLTRKLYWLEDGSVEDRSFEMPDITASSRPRIGFAQDGRICFADGDGSRFRWVLGENTLRLSMSQAGNQAAQLTWNALPGQSYIIEAKDTLSLPFAEVARDILASSFSVNTAPNAPMRFYRVRPH